MGFTRDLGPSKNQSYTYEAYGNAEDMSSVVTNIEPEQTYFLSSLKTAPKATAKKFNWTTEGLRPPQKNAHLEKEDYVSQAVGSMEGMENYTQKFINSGFVTDDQIEVDKIYGEKNELVRQIRNAVTGQARDMEYAIVHNAMQRAGTATTAALTGGIPYFMSLQTLAATVSTTDGKVTTTVAHNLQTGDFIYFVADTMPTGLKQGTMYFVRLDTTTPEKNLYLFDSIDDAIENVTANIVKPTAAGTNLKIVKNNIKDLGGTTDFTVDDINDVMQMAYNRGGNPTEAVMSGSKKRRFSQIVSALGTTQRKSGDKKMDIVTDVLASDFGTITAKTHRMYNDNRIDLLDKQYFELKWFRQPHQVKGLPKKGTYEEFVLEADFGLQGTQPKASASITGIKR